MRCRIACGACCIAPSISSALPGMPDGKPAGQRCLHLDRNYACKLWGDPQRPQVCDGFKPEPWLCGQDREQALRNIRLVEQAT